MPKLYIYKIVGAHHEDSGGIDTGSAYVFK